MLCLSGTWVFNSRLSTISPRSVRNIKDSAAIWLKEFKNKTPLVISIMHPHTLAEGLCQCVRYKHLSYPFNDAIKHHIDNGRGILF